MRRLARSARQRALRYLRRLEVAEDSGDEPGTQKWLDLYQQAASDVAVREPAPVTTAPEGPLAPLTPEEARMWSDDDLAGAWNRAVLADDLAGRSAIEAEFDRRDDESAEARELETAAAEREAARMINDGWGETAPWARPARGLTREQACRESFEEYRMSAYLTAEAEFSPNLLNARGKAKGIDAYSLFIGPARVAKAYASEELGDFWKAHGRMTYGKFRNQWLESVSDRERVEAAA